MRRGLKYTVLAAVILTFQLWVGLIAEASGNIYYINAVSGNDANSGLSEDEAWRSAEKLTEKLKTGDTVLFHTDQAWNNVYMNLSCSNLTFGAYGTGERPVLSGAVTAFGWKSAENEILPQGYTADRSTLYVLPAILEREPYLIRAGDILFQKTSSNTIEAGTYLYDDVSNRIYLCSTEGNPDLLGITQIQQQPHIFYIQAKTNITIKDLHLTMTGGAGVNIQSGDSKYIKVENNEFSYAQSYDSDGSGINCSNIKFSVFKDNIIHDMYGDGILLWNCEGNTVEGNKIWNVFRGKNTGGDGIQSAGKAGNAAPDNKIINNQINMSNAGTGKGCIQQENGDRAVITGNLCLYGSFGVECNSNYGVVKNNICAYQGTQTPYNWTAGIYMSENEDITGMTICDNIVYGSRPYGIRLGGPSENYRNDFQVYNNTVCSNGTAFAALTPFGGIVKNNIFYDFSSKTAGSVYHISTIKEGEEVISDHNVFYPNRAGFIAWQGITYNTIWAFREIKGMDEYSRISKPIFYGDKNGWSTPPRQEEFRLYQNSPGARDGTQIISNGETIYQNGCAAGALQELIETSEPDVEDPIKPADESRPLFQKGLIAYEGFAYDALRPVQGLNGGIGWKEGWLADNSRIDPETMMYDGIYATGRKALFKNSMSRQLAEPAGSENGTYYLSFIMKNPTGYGFTITLSDGEKSMYVRKESKSKWQAKLRTKWITSATAADNDGLVIMKLTTKDNRTDLSVWVNPDLTNGTELGTADVFDYAAEKIAPCKIGFFLAEGAGAYAQLDEIRVGKTLESVTRQIYSHTPQAGAGNLMISDDKGAVENGIYYNAISGGLRGKAYVYSDSGTDLSGCLFAALKKGGVLVALKQKPFFLPADDTGEKSIEIDFENFPDDDYTLQLFCWENRSIKPLSEGKTIYIYKSIPETPPTEE